MRSKKNSKTAMFIIFGATGDLTKRKLIPGIYNLLNHNRIDNFHIIGVARRSLTNEKLINSSKKFIKNPKEKIISKLRKNSSYVQLDFKQNNYEVLKEKINQIEKKGKCNKLFYLATDSNNFKTISENIQKIGIAKENNCWARVVFEKPFGLDLKSSDKLNKSIKKIFSEDQIYRIDHYLGKELVGNISVVRFSNTILEPIWNNKYIENIQIVLDEEIDIEERGSFYDRYGAIRDVVQNHMLQLLALVTMEMPKSFSKDFIRDEKTKLLKSVRVVDTIVGQYNGYTKEKGIPKNSKTETFAALKLEINNKRWKGVPIYLRTGKLLEKKQTKLIIKFKKIKCLFGKNCPANSNYLELRIFPDEGIAFELNAKVPGEISAIPVKMDFCHSCTFGPNTPEGYENLFADIIKGDQCTFIREDELRNSWKIVDKIKRGRVYSYKKGSKGPKELEGFNRKHKVKWM